ncbi:hypothetical protein K1T71_013617 [Dendrolimus kikuchii]|uniref:Uncharacterized protein n=1 Tax=Dendrolimus kikuchii TaxID=765133 RepID=A0ACC1CH54_9NEOP|nr:hypothetical protein K1T71_013617 [Dendrolimus kikuchii]
MIVFKVNIRKKYFCYSFRRVREGKDVTKDKTYASRKCTEFNLFKSEYIFYINTFGCVNIIYKIRAEPSKHRYDEWLCGGAIVNKWFIVTSAACVEDVQHMYAIAGYKKMVLFDTLNKDPCTKDMKKRVVFTCVPKSYEFDYANIAKWATIDIAAVRVESEFDFNDARYETACSYKPTQIDINYEFKYQEPGTDVLIMGWGHATKWRAPTDSNVYNAESLKVASALVVTKKECKDNYENLDTLIDKYMICVNGDGNIDDKGEIIEKIKPVLLDGCVTAQQKLQGFPGKECDLQEENEVNKYKNITTFKSIQKKIKPEEKQYEYEIKEPVVPPSKKKMKRRTTTRVPEIEYDDEVEEQVLSTRKKKRKTKKKNIPKVEEDYEAEEADVGQEEHENYELITSKRKRKPVIVYMEESRKAAGICQNDHGSPIVTWRGSQEILIGVASVFRVLPSKGECTGPYLFTSTQCNGIFLDCVINESPNETRRTNMSDICHSPPKERGFDIIRRHISWKDHPHGPADNEMPRYQENLYHVAMRPQVPISYYGI